jgi:PleD family two-component response regulator
MALTSFWTWTDSKARNAKRLYRSWKQQQRGCARQKIHRYARRTMTTNRSSILVVDDTEANIDILKNMLDDDHDFMVTMDGTSALA